MNNTELVAKLHNVVDNYKTIYMWGVFGSPITESIIVSKTKQYPSYYTAKKQAELRAVIGKGYFGFDCVNLIKGLLWGWNGNAAKPNGGAVYASSGIPDVSANSLLPKLLNVSTNFSKMDVGDILWMEGHVGVYIGNGKVIEATPAWKGGVQVSACHNIAKIPGMNGRTWTKTGKLPFLTYVSAEEPVTSPAPKKEVSKPKPTTPVAKPAPVIKVGSKVRVKPGSTTFEGKSVSAFVFKNVYTVDDIKNSRAILDRKGICTPFNISDLLIQ